MSDFSQKEIEMFTALGYAEKRGSHSLIEYFGKVDKNPMALYRIAVDHCFQTNKQGPAVESLRRTWNAIQEVSVYRCTEEFNSLIDLEDARCE